MSVLLVIVILIVLVLVHESGHFSIAKLFGIRVDSFNIGFPPKLLTIKYGETEYSFNLLLLGGYVQIHGEDPSDVDASDRRAFSNRNRWVQAAVLLGGIVFNLIFGWLLLSGGYMAGMPTSVEHDGVGQVSDPHPMIVSLLPGSPGEKAGLMAGDTVETLQTGATQLDAYHASADEVRAFIGAHADESIVLTILRGGKEDHYLARPAAGLVDGRKAIGIELDDVGTLKLSPPLALYEGGILAKNLIVETGKGLGAFLYNLVRGAPDFSQVAGPIGIVHYGGIALQEGFSQIVVLAASISIALGLFNLVPFPGLDGGRLFIVAVEGITRRAVPPRVVASLTLGGLALLVVLALVVSYHDVIKWVG